MSTSKTTRKPQGLTGRCFITWEADAKGRRVVQYQGTIVDELGDGLLLVHFFSALTGDPYVMAIIPVSRLVLNEMKLNAPGTVTLFENDECLRDFMYETYYPQRRAEAADDA